MRTMFCGFATPKALYNTGRPPSGHPNRNAVAQVKMAHTAEPQPGLYQSPRPVCETPLGFAGGGVSA